MITVHRHTFPVRDVIELLLEASPEADRWQMRVEGEELVIDIVGPVISTPLKAANDPVKTPEPETATEARRQPQEGPGDQTVVETPPSAQADAPASEGAELKGGRLAMKASMLCQDKTFRLWIDAEDADAARAIVLKHCGVDSRRLLDHDDGAAEKWHRIDRLYAAWMQGDDEAVMPEIGEMVL